MRTTKNRGGLRGWGTALILVSAACTGVATEPVGGGGGAGGGSGTGAAAGGGPASGGPGAATAGGMGSGAMGGGAPGDIGKAVAGMQSGAPAPLDAARVFLRRLNVAEYDNTVHDLLGSNKNPGMAAATLFPGDSATYGFDTVGEGLTFSLQLLAQQDAAASGLVDELLARPVGDPLRAKVLVCEPTAANAATCYNQILTGFMKSAYRRPVTAAEVQTMTTLATTYQSTSVTEGLSAALRAVLLSPNFLFHVELGSPAVTPTSSAVANLTDYELASRMSYFLWSTMPDAALTQAADMGMLAGGKGAFQSQLSRMLADPKVQALTTNFAGQWLGIRDVAQVAPDPTVFTAPAVDDALIGSIALETSAFFQNLVAGNMPLTDLVTANFSYINGRLATQYGVSGVPATQMTYTKTTLPPNRAAGVLTQDTFLTTTSLPGRTSPVKRGAWVLDRMLCSAPALPPPNVPSLPAQVASTGKTVRQILDQHATNPACASCHTTIDPAGYPFEEFDAMGAYRTKDNGTAIDTTGSLVLAGGTAPTAVADANAFGQLVSKDPRFAACMVKQLATYGIGRSFEAADALSYVASIASPLQSTGKWQDAILAVATSQAFLTTRGGQ
jgi:Protein of unknown function (DUF1592)/Protein of unknown function (DUF1588)/Protein of unknown function (DUF1595)/Protein of unknown function (DUF1587)/Protein of unknown function (DUF1585)